MSHITTCPSCHTAFRTSEEQLGARQGLVRCGRCSTIFDGRAHLTQPAAVPAAQESPSSVTTPSSEPHPSHAESLIVRAFQPAAELQAEPPQPADAELETAGVADEIAAAAATTPVETEPALSADHPAAIATAAESAAADTTLYHPSVYPAQARRWPARLAALLLLITLGAQALFLARHEVALAVPETRPWLKELCAGLGCQIQLPQQAGQLSIESSDLSNDPARADTVMLSVILRNHAPHLQAYPSLGLTLQDSYEQPIARRTLTPPDYLGNAAAIEQGFAANSEHFIKLYFDIRELKASGYQLQVFYSP